VRAFFSSGFLLGPFLTGVLMLLQNRLNHRIAEAISHKLQSERKQWDTESTEWKMRCEIAQVAMLSDCERTTFIHHLSEQRGSGAAAEIEAGATKLRRAAIFSLASKTS
jgi:hypothetical protein